MFNFKQAANNDAPAARAEPVAGSRQQERARSNNASWLRA